MSEIHLLSPGRIGSLETANRVVMAPMTRSRARAKGVPSELAIEYYKQRASAGLIIAEATNVAAQSNAWDCAPGIFTPAHIHAWRPLVAAVHAASGRIALQLWDGGRVAADRSPYRLPSLSPSGVNENVEAFTVWGRGDEGTVVTL